MKTVSNFVKSEKYLFKDCVNSFIPLYSVVPLKQSDEKEFVSVIKEGDSIKEGQVIAENSDGKEIAEKLHSPVPGTLSKIEECCLPDGSKSKACFIKLGGEFSYLGKKLKAKDWKTQTSENLLAKFDENGIVNTFKETVYLASQIRSCTLSKNRFVAVRLFDEDPSRMTDTFIAEKYTEQVIEGALIIAKASNAQGIIFALPHGHSFTYDFTTIENLPWFKVEIDVKRYPAGFRESIIHAVKRSARNTKDMDFTSVNYRNIFVDSETCLSVYEAVVFDKPVVDRFVHVTGDCLQCSGLFRVRTGTTFRNLAEQCGGFRKNPVKIVVNGVITGNAVSSLDTPVTKSVKSITFLTVQDLSDQHTEQCIRCGNCRRVCPEGIYPDLLYRHSKGGKKVGDDLLLTVKLCSECSLCNSVCPSRIPLSQTISMLRDRL